jgi:hypothetical protein
MDFQEINKTDSNIKNWTACQFFFIYLLEIISYNFFFRSVLVSISIISNMSDKKTSANVTSATKKASAAAAKTPVTATPAPPKAEVYPNFLFILSIYSIYK